MKKIYKSIIALAASLLLLPTVSAQTYLVDETSGFGYNKYLKSDTPNEKGEYTIRIENFATGELKMEKRSTPSDIVLVLDMSGSMLYDYILSGTGAPSLSEQLIQETGSLANGYATYDPGAYNQSTGASSSTARVQNLTNHPNNGATSMSAICASPYRRFISYQGGFYSVSRQVVTKTVDGVTSYYCYLKFTKSNQDYYLFGYESDEDGGIHAITDNDPQNIPSEHLFTTNKAVWRGRLYRYPSRLEALRDAVGDFITAIAKNDSSEVKPFLNAGEVGNRISLVKFAGNGYFSGWPREPETDLAAALAERNNKNESSVVKQFTTLTTGYGADVDMNTTNITALRTALASMWSESNTPIDCGANLARLLFLDADDEYPAVDASGRVKLRNRTVIFFTDGDPVKSGSDFCKITNAALNYAVQIKETGSGKINSKIFAIGLNPSTSSKPFLERLSSNYPDALQTTTSGGAGSAVYTGTQIPAYDDVNDPEHLNNLRVFYSDAATTDISKIFDSIAEYAGGGAGATSSSMTAIDIVSHSFVLPPDVQLSDIKVYTAPCIGTTGETWTDSHGVEHEYLAFADKTADVILAEAGDNKGRAPLTHLWVAKFDDDGEPIIDPETEMPVWEDKSDYDIDHDIAISFDKTDNTVTVSGFNYGELWCGVDPLHENSIDYDPANYPENYKPGYRGFKLIIEFPIMVKEDAVGGPKVITNEEGSGLFTVDDSGQVVDKLFDYPQPTLPIPVNLWLQKTGLRPGESATLTIYRKLAEKENESDPDPEYSFYTRVIITGTADGEPAIKKLLNLDPKYYYKIWEEGWSWSYSNQAQDQGKVPSTETVFTNPIEIDNKPIPNTPKHAEAKVTNVMSQSGSSATTVQDVN